MEEIAIKISLAKSKMNSRTTACLTSVVSQFTDGNCYTSIIT